MEAKYLDLVDKLEQQLNESEENFKIITEQSIIGIGIFQDNTIQYINEGASKICEYSIQEMRERTVDDILGMVHPERIPFVKEQIKQKQSGDIDAIHNLGYRIITKSKQVKWIEQYFKPISYQEKPAKLYIWIDITNKKEIEIAIRNAHGSIFNVIENGIRVIDKNFNVINMNQAYIELTGANKDKLEGIKCYQQFSHSNCHSPECTLNRILAGEICIEMEVIKKRQDGSEVPCIQVATAIQKTTGEVIGIIEIYKDLTFQKHIERKLKESETQIKKFEKDIKENERFLSNVFSSIQDGLCIIDKDYTIIRVNPTMKKWYPHMIPLGGKKCYQVYQHRNNPCEDCLCQQIYETCKPITKVISRKGSKAEDLGTLEVYTFPLLDKLSGKIKGVIEYLRDVTEKVSAEQELKESELKYRSILENIKEGIFETDLKGNYTFFNKAFCDILKRSEEELIGRNYSDNIDEVTSRYIFQAFNEVFNSEIPKSNLEFELTSKKGEKIFIHSSAYLSHDSSGNKRGFTGIIRDITEKKNAEEMITREIQKLKELDIIKTEFISRASHELKTPLVLINSTCQLIMHLNRENFDEESRSLFNIIKKGGERLEYLIRNLLDVSRLDSNEFELKIRKRNIIKIIKECIEDVKHLAEFRKLKIVQDLPKDFYIKIDSIKMRQVILNILWNALKNTPPFGQISLSIEKQKGFVDIKIVDTGVGFTKKEREIIFKKFGKIERYGKGMDVDTEGPGLGLYISRKIVNAHGGEILVESQGRNKGATFTIRLPKKLNYLF
jgi:PAS domain S-box-containing protein